jgi:hypothetical protein
LGWQPLEGLEKLLTQVLQLYKGSDCKRGINDVSLVTFNAEMAAIVTLAFKAHRGGELIRPLMRRT